MIKETKCATSSSMMIVRAKTAPQKWSALAEEEEVEEAEAAATGVAVVEAAATGVGVVTAAVTIAAAAVTRAAAAAVAGAVAVVAAVLVAAAGAEAAGVEAEAQRAALESCAAGMLRRVLDSSSLTVLAKTIRTCLSTSRILLTEKGAYVMEIKSPSA